MSESLLVDLILSLSVHRLSLVVHHLALEHHLTLSVHHLVREVHLRVEGRGVLGSVRRGLGRRGKGKGRRAARLAKGVGLGIELASHRPGKLLALKRSRRQSSHRSRRMIRRQIWGRVPWHRWDL